MTERRKQSRSKKTKQVSQDSLNEIGRMAKLISDLIQEEVTDGANPYAAAVALECQVQAYCRQTGASSSELTRTAVGILDDPRIQKPIVVEGEQKS